MRTEYPVEPSQRGIDPGEHPHTDVAVESTTIARERVERRRAHVGDGRVAAEAGPLDGEQAGGEVVVLVAPVREVEALAEERAARDGADEPHDVATHRVALLGGVERLAVVEPREEVLDVLVGGVPDEDDGQERPFEQLPPPWVEARRNAGPRSE